MRTYGLLALLIIGGCTLASGQSASHQVKYQKTLHASLHASIALDGHTFSVANVMRSGSMDDNVQYLRSVSTDALGNLVIAVQLPHLVGEEFYFLNFSVFVNGRRYRIEPEWLSTYKVIRQTQQTEMLITWYNAFDHVPFQVGTFTLDLEAEFHSEDYPCPNEMPVFDWKRQRPHLLTAVAGGAIVGIAQLGIMQSANDEYDRYKAAVIEVPPDNQGTGQEDPEDILETARDRRKTANSLTIAGSALLAGSAVTYVIRSIRIRRQHKDWLKYCGNHQPTISLEPRYETSGAGPSAGLALTIRF
ncbi:MAG: hypothetical protein R3330_01190 [Saprospiraceae bacterium]|nr:hypothetical protein [Saprospiraceae bacterium]